MSKFLPEFCLSIVGILSNTNISESSFKEIIEMFIKDEAVKKVTKDSETALNNVLTAMNNDAENGKKVDNNKVKAAEAIGKKLKKIYKKWGNIINND